MTFVFLLPRGLLRGRAGETNGARQRSAPAIARTPRRNASGTNINPRWMATPTLGRPHATSQHPHPQPLGRTTCQPWLATPRDSAHPQQLQNRVACLPGPRRPSHDPITNRPLRQPSFHHKSVWPGVHIRFRFVQDPVAPSSPSPFPLSVPSPSTPPLRIPGSMYYSGSFEGQGRTTGNSSGAGVSRRRRPSDYLSLSWILNLEATCLLDQRRIEVIAHMYRYRYTTKHSWQLTPPWPPL